MAAQFSSDGMAALTGSKASEKSADSDGTVRMKSTSIGEANLSKKAQEFLKKLRSTYGNMEFFVADFDKGDNAKDILSNATKEFSVMLSSEELEKMASDEEYAAEYMNRVQGAVRMSEQINREFGFTSASGDNANASKLSKIAINFKQDGTMTFFAELEKLSQKQRERIESAREKRNSETRIVQADSIEEILKKIKEFDWNKDE